MSLRKSLAEWIASALELARVRLELLGSELEMASHHLLTALWWTGAALVVCTGGLGLICAAVILSLPQDRWAQGLIIMAALLIGIGLLLLRLAHQGVRQVARVFQLSQLELDLDQRLCRGETDRAAR
ncbi:MAG: hypothetical protein FGM55_03645 [Rhodoferax sp.]|nr:hypothetical protein [Rhodoferax sp.]